MLKQKLKILGVLPILSILILIGFVTPTKAAQFINENTYTLEQTEIVEENIYIKSDIVDISGVVDSDLFIGASTVTVSGTVTGDLYIAANQIDITGNVYGSTYLAGRNIDIGGNIARNAVIVSLSADVSGNVGRDLTVYTGRSTITGRVTEDVRVFASTSTISGIVKGEAMVFADNTTINQELVEGEIYENIEVGEVSEALSDGFKINVYNWDMGKHLKRGFMGINVLITLLSFVAMYIVGVVLIYLAPVKTLKIEKKVIGSTQEFLYSFLVGLGIVVLIPMPLFILLFSGIGTPLAILILGALFFIAIFGSLWVESAIGYRLLQKTDKKDPKRLLSLLVGRGITTVINFIPIVRGLYKTVLNMTAIGAVVRMKYDCYRSSKGTKRESKKENKSKSKKKK
jgi:cytoskeletal protein CcmA (bactofilin family)/uncharacterized membrane protein YhaH (DUF805 family)